jgi:hypothetical protein
MSATSWRFQTHLPEIWKLSDNDDRAIAAPLGRAGHAGSA